MVKIPTAEELTGTQLKVTPGAKPNFLLPINAMTEPYLQMADAAQRSGNALVEYGVSLQDAKNKTILNNSVLTMKNELQNYQQEIYRGLKNFNMKGEPDGTFTPYDPLKFNELLSEKKNNLIETHVTNNKDARGLLANQIKSTFEIEFLQISDAVNKEANKRIDKEHIISNILLIEAWKAELTTDLNLDENAIAARYLSIDTKLLEIQHKIPSQTFLNLVDSIKYDIAEGQFLNWSKNIPIPNLTQVMDLSKGFDFKTINNKVVADTMKLLYETNPEMVQDIFDAAIKQQTDEIKLENSYELNREKKEKRLENDYLKGIFLNDEVGDEADAARQLALTHLKNLKSTDYKTIELAEAYLSDENVFADTTVESVYFNLNKNIRYGTASYDDITDAHASLTKETFQELMALQAAGLKDLQSSFSKSIMNKYGVVEDFIDNDNPVHGIIVMNAALANNELQEWIRDPDNKKIAGSAAFNTERDRIYEKYNIKIKSEIIDQIKQGFGRMLKKQFGNKLPVWFDYNDLPGTIKKLEDPEFTDKLTPGQIMGISMVLNQYQGYFDLLEIN